MPRLTLIVFLNTLLICLVSRADDYTYVRSDGRQATIRLNERSDSTAVIEYWVEDGRLSEWVIKYPVFQFCCGDLTGDGVPEIAVGVVKSTKYSPQVGRRLFLFKLFEEELIRPLWLSSRLAHRLVNFDIEPDGIVLTQEVKADGTPVRVKYEHRGFGLKFVEYIQN
ncbi:MAG: nuclear receptor-binding factor 2 [Bacteroidaceae bacterium]|nr:nuclear receptor-binding factor 2 [Bacteroidaceae bacterium]